MICCIVSKYYTNASQNLIGYSKELNCIDIFDTSGILKIRYVQINNI